MIFQIVPHLVFGILNQYFKFLIIKRSGWVFFQLSESIIGIVRNLPANRYSVTVSLHNGLLFFSEDHISPAYILFCHPFVKEQALLIDDTEHFPVADRR